MQVCECVESLWHRASSRLGTVKHPILLIIAVGIVVRLVLMSASMVYDLDYWAVVIRNIESGEGLYDAEGYYYTPVWGYILGIMAAFQSAFLGLGELAVRVLEAFPVEIIPDTYYTATAPSLAFIYSVKIPLMVFDLILAFLVMVLAKDYTGDARKATMAFGLTFLFPVLMLSSGVIGMPDTMAAVFTVLTIVLLRREMPFLAGMTFSLAVLTKFFPVFLIFVFVAYLIVKNRGNTRKGLTQIVMAVAGAGLATVIVFMPQIVEGNVDQCFQFLFDRTSTVTGGTIFDSIVSILRIAAYAAVLVLSAYLGVRMVRRHETDPDVSLMKASFIIATLCLIYPPTTQYMVIIVPFLAFWIACHEHQYLVSWAIMAIGSIIYVFASNSLTILPLAVWTDLIGVDAVMAIFDWFNTTCIGPVSIRSLQFVIGGVIQCAGVVSVLYIMYGDRFRDWKRGCTVERNDQ